MKRIATSIITLIGKSIEYKRFTDPPVYIGGCGRSGTTLLLSILSAHPEIFACPRELGLFQHAEIKGDRIQTPKFYRLYRTLILSKIPANAKRYCEKSPSNIYNIDMMDRLHRGNFRFIQIIRDGRDVILSKHPRNNDRYWVSPERWIHDVSMGLKYLEHPAVYTIKYEDLVLNYEETVKGICSFLDIPFCEEIRNWHEHARVRENKALFAPIREISKDSIGKWKMKEHHQRVYELIEFPEAMELLRKLNYL